MTLHEAVTDSLTSLTARPDSLTRSAIASGAVTADSAASLSASGDSAAYHRHVTPFVPVELVKVGEPTRCLRDESPRLSGADLHGMRIGIPPYTHGMQPAARNHLPGYDSGVLLMLLVVFLFLSYNIGHYSTLLKNFGADLFSVRKRKDVFEQHTYSEVGLLISIVLMACLSEGILLNAALTGLGFPPAPQLGVFGVIAILTVIAIAYYMWQLAAYKFTGFVFADRQTAGMWMVGFKSSQALAGMLLVIPAVVVLFNPGAWNVMVPLGAAFYVVARLIFISKGFRLFYDNFGSLIYFILYLCSLEIVPLVLICRGAIFLNSLWP